MKTKEILIEARRLIQDPANWTQGTLARDSFGESVPPADGVCWCAAGSVVKVAGNDRNTDGELAWEKSWSALDSSAIALYGEEVPNVNDNIGHEAVLKVYDHAIANCEDRP